MLTSPSLLSVYEAAQLLGLSRHAVVELIATGRLTWTMAADKKTVLVEVPSDLNKFVREIGAVRSREAAREAPPADQPHRRSEARLRRSERPALSDLDAWSQPK